VESGGAGRIALVAATSADCRDVIVEGESGMLRCAPPWDRPEYEPSKRRLTWRNGATATLFSAEEPDRLRGPQFDAAYVDELAAWPHLGSAGNAWDMLQFALRLGASPRVVITTTPRPLQIVRDFLADPTCVVTRGTTMDNAANLAPQFVDQILSRYEGTRLYQQEVEGRLLEDVAGAILSSELIAELRVPEAPASMGRVVVGVDPAITSGDSADHTGIVVAGLDSDGDLYALEDLSCQLGPAGWARRVVDAYRKHGADLIVAERNQGGLMVEHTLRSVADVPIKLVNATRGKHVRAEPILARFEQRRAHTVAGLGKLEEQLVAFTPAGYEADDSPDSADAFVWAATELTTSPGAQVFI
jgi:phage terminase large subunit-like protein